MDNGKSPSLLPSTRRTPTCDIFQATLTDEFTTTLDQSNSHSCLQECPTQCLVADTTPENKSERGQKRKLKPDEPIRNKKLRGEVPCDVCATSAAAKSCLVCLSSYCEDHLKIHSSQRRFKGHKLVQPIPNLDQRACMTHGRPLELYSRLQEKCICALCLEPGEEGVVSSEVEWDSKKAKLDKTIMELKEKIKNKTTKMEEINSSLKRCKEELDSEWWDIDGSFDVAVAIVEAARYRALKPVEERRQRLEKEAKELTDQLQTEVNKLERDISELQKISGYEDHILFLQEYPSSKEPLRKKNRISLELDTSFAFGSMRKVTETMKKQIQDELDKLTSLELQRLRKFTEDVKLDPKTRDRGLVVSKNQKEVIDGEIEQKVDDKRFDVFRGVLGLNRFSSGRSYWEVQVGNKSSWGLGLAAAKASRKGKLRPSPDNGYWAIIHYEGDKYAALTAPPVCLELKSKPQKVGVFLDYEEGLVSFYDATTQTHIYSFSNAAFSDELLPYFSPNAKDKKNSEPLVISPVCVEIN